MIESGDEGTSGVRSASSHRAPRHRKRGRRGREKYGFRERFLICGHWRVSVALNLWTTSLTVGLGQPLSLLLHTNRGKRSLLNRTLSEVTGFSVVESYMGENHSLFFTCIGVVPSEWFFPMMLYIALNNWKPSFCCDHVCSIST